VATVLLPRYHSTTVLLTLLTTTCRVGVAIVSSKGLGQACDVSALSEIQRSRSVCNVHLGTLLGRAGKDPTTKTQVRATIEMQGIRKDKKGWIIEYILMSQEKWKLRTSRPLLRATPAIQISGGTSATAISRLSDLVTTHQ